MKFEVYRDPYTKRFRKWVVKAYYEDKLVDHRFMFGGPRFAKRLERKLKRMEKMHDIIWGVING